MKQKTKNKEKNKLPITIIAVALIIVLIGGGTYAYWTWQSNDAQKTNINVTVAGANMTISGTNVTQTAANYLYPVADCRDRNLVGTTTVTVNNQTESTMTVSLKLKGTLGATHGTLDDDDKSHLHWAVVETSNGTLTSGTCSAATTATALTNTCYNVTDGQSNMDTGTFEGVTSGTDIDTTLTFVANGVEVNASTSDSCVTTRTYQVYVWLDSGYEFTISGSNLNDPMQDLAIELTWSQNSSMTQNPN